MQTELIFSQEDSLANHTPKQESEKVKKMKDISGQKCLEQLEKFNQVGLWAKMFSDLLIGQKDWFSTKCKLTWKLKGTKYFRMYFQLQPSTLHTEEIEFGLLPTITTSDARDFPNKLQTGQIQKNKSGTISFVRNKDGMKFGASMREIVKIQGLLPTPTAMDSTNATATMKSSQVKEGSMHSVTLSRAMTMGMLPTPMASDCGDKVTGLENQMSLVKLARTQMLPTPSAYDWNTVQTQEKYQERKQHQADKGVNLHYPLKQMCMDINPNGKTSQLSPQFVMEMMGFPTDWTLLPFLNGETSQSKLGEMQ